MSLNDKLIPAHNAEKNAIKISLKKSAHKFVRQEKERQLLVGFTSPRQLLLTIKLKKATWNKVIATFSMQQTDFLSSLASLILFRMIVS